MPEGRGTVRNRSFARGDDGRGRVNDPGPVRNASPRRRRRHRRTLA